MGKLILLSIVSTMISSMAFAGTTWQCSKSNELKVDITIERVGGWSTPAHITIIKDSRQFADLTGKFVKSEVGYSTGRMRVVNYNFSVQNIRSENCSLQYLQAQAHPYMYSDRLANILDKRGITLSWMCTGNPFLINQTITCKR